MQDAFEAIIYDLETSLLKPEIRSSSIALDRLLADDFREFGSSGEIYDKKSILERLPQDSEIAPVEFSVSDFGVQKLADGLALATFKLDKLLSDKSHVISLRASLWRKSGEGWQMVFHQGTQMK